MLFVATLIKASPLATLRPTDDSLATTIEQDTARESTKVPTTKVGPIWPTTNLTVQILNFSKDLPVTKQREAIKLACELWTRDTIINLTLINSSQSADIKISFEPDNHSDGFPFGTTSILSHTFYPGSFELAGQIHFNAGVDWKEKEDYFFVVAASSIGRAMGLSSNYKSVESVMYPMAILPIAIRDMEFFVLPQVDVVALNSLYSGFNRIDESMPK